MGQAREPVFIQAFVPNAPVERFDVRVLIRLAWRATPRRRPRLEGAPGKSRREMPARHFGAARRSAAFSSRVLHGSSVPECSCPFRPPTIRCRAESSFAADRTFPTGLRPLRSSRHRGRFRVPDDNVIMAAQLEGFGDHSERYVRPRHEGVWPRTAEPLHCPKNCPHHHQIGDNFSQLQPTRSNDPMSCNATLSERFFDFG